MNADAMLTFIESQWHPVRALEKQSKQKRELAKKILSFREGLDGRTAYCQAPGCFDKQPIDIANLRLVRRKSNAIDYTIDDLAVVHPYCMHRFYLKDGINRGFITCLGR